LAVVAASMSGAALNAINERDPIRTVRSAGYALDDTFR
jgi:hypothetical protein